MSTHSRKIFVNLPVRDLKRSMGFFSALGFTFNPQFTDDNAACMIISDDAFAMLLSVTHLEGLFAISCGSRAEVDTMVKAALGAGGSRAMDPQDHGFMYGWSFIDPDGHHWEPTWMDPAAIQPVLEQGGQR